MKTTKKLFTNTLIAIALIVTITVTMLALPYANSAVPNLTRKATVYIAATPNPVGIGQETLIHVGMVDELQAEYLGWKGLTVTIEKPDGTTETLTDINTDSTGGTGRIYTPSVAGNYTIQAHFPAQWQNVTVNGGANIYYPAADSPQVQMVVTQDPLPSYPGHALPTEYWSRPIDSQLREWYEITGNWLTTYPANRYAKYNSEAPESSHILWAKTLAEGGLSDGLIGADNTTHSYEDGSAYENKFYNSVILSGVLYYNLYESRGDPYAEQKVVAVDLKTGEELWAKPLIGKVARSGTTAAETVATSNIVLDGVSDAFPNGVGRRLAFGQLFYWNSYNYDGAYALLWTTSGTTWMAFDACTGRWIYTIMNVPTGTTVYGVNGELLRVDCQNTKGYIALWNSSNLVSAAGSWNPHGNVYNASGTGAGPKRAWEWNVTIPKLPGSVMHVLDDRVLGSDYGSDRYIQQAIVRQNAPITFWAVSTDPENPGRLLFNTTWTPPADQTIYSKAASLDDGFFLVTAKESATHYAFDINTGKLLWGPTAPQNYLDSFSILLYGAPKIVYGNVYCQAMSGILYCYDGATGKTLWTYTPTDPYNEVLWSDQWTSTIMFIADGKIYSGNYEHSPETPRARGATFTCINATTGELIWIQDGIWPTSYTPDAMIGDSTIVLMDAYDNRIYAYGKGPTATEVTAPSISVTAGNSIIVSGSVTDISPGTNAYALTSRFPNGVPAVSDASQSEWMLYVYKQFERPTNATGVPVIISAIDPNGNYVILGSTTTDASGTFGYNWVTPDITGEYKITATFAGSASYYSSNAQTYAVITAAPDATAQPTEKPQTLSETYFIPAIAGLFIALIVGFAVILLVIRKRP
jgi:outer membrane protein assembly factor BamB